MVVVVDTCSLHRLVEYYLPFDKEGVLILLLENLFKARDIVMTELVYTECTHMSKGIIVKRLPFINSANFKKALVKADSIIPPQKFLRMVDENFTIRGKFNSLSPEKQEAQRTMYFQSGDFSLLLCAYLKSKGLANGLFPEELRILTDESNSDNDNKYFKKIPSCCRMLEIETINIREYLELVTGGKLKLIIQQD